MREDDVVFNGEQLVHGSEDIVVGIFAFSEQTVASSDGEEFVVEIGLVVGRVELSA